MRQEMTQEDRITQIGDNVSLLLERSNTHTAQLSALFAKLDKLQSGGCARYPDIERRIESVEERPGKTIGIAAGLSGIVAAIVALVVKLWGAKP